MGVGSPAGRIFDNPKMSNQTDALIEGKFSLSRHFADLQSPLQGIGESSMGWEAS